jgi:peroxiredoxin
MECPEKIGLKGCKRMKMLMNGWIKKIMLSAVPVVLCLILSHLAPAANLPPPKDDVLPTLNLIVPKNLNEKAYLGLSGSGLFKIPQIKTKVVIVEIFSMYCPICQKDAPGINEMYQTIENNPDLKTRMKLIGIGTGNSPYEVEVFKKKYQVPFPLFADKDFTIHKAIGEVRTPHFIVIKINEEGTPEVILSQSGDFQGAASFLELILKASGLN